MVVGTIVGIGFILGILLTPFVLYMAIETGKNEKRMSEEKDYDDWE
ncbi:uncharacterized protein HHUB_4160 (plasmid) [Halobacterium hubeiense]|uniref:Uncharacterized protein n=1 Tax=Halobacterium hubeiense TaxID=1407499 RepID=A0A0U5H5V3_9EURY|nr:hypothetical protein [Halobacterium hubeiense]CQH63700.1 uncharacterized protein HHUB_4160 [Halobacterium hubeiense]